MIANRNAGLTSGQRSPANKINDSAHNVTQAMIHNGSADTGSHSMMSITKHLMPQPNDASVEDYKMELKQCLKENIVMRREVKHLRQRRKEGDAKIEEL